MNFITIFKDIEVASTNQSINVTNQFENISGTDLLNYLSQLPIGFKDGSHFLRTSLNTNNNGCCLSRSGENMNSLAKLIIIDCDKHLDEHGKEVEGAPDPKLIHDIFLDKDVGHIIYGSHSHYVGDKGYRYRILLATNKPYNKTQLQPTAEGVVQAINSHLDYPLLAYAKENHSYAQGWYYPRKPQDSDIQHLYLNYLEGKAIDLIEPSPPTINRKENKPRPISSPIDNFNDKNPLPELLIQYGYKRVLATSEHEKWLSPRSTSGKAGITVKDNRFFSHHNDDFNDGYWHDAFDLMRISEGLSESDAVKKVSATTQELNAYYKSKTIPRELPDPRPPVKQFEREMLPDGIRDYVYDVAERQQSLPDFVAVAAIVGLSGLLGRKVLICPKQSDDWTVTPNQWGAIIGRPSAMKSPSMKEALKPLQKFNDEAVKQFKKDEEKYQEDCELIQIEIKEAKKKATNAFKKDGRDAAREALRLDNEATKPVRKRFTVNDATVEKLGELLNENPNGLILVRDELSGWLSKLYREDYQSDRAFYLESFDGNGRYTYDRIGRGTIEIENCTLSIIGGIQPSKIAKLVRDAINGSADDGLIQRLQLAVWPDDIGSWKWIDRAPDQKAKTKYYDAFVTIHNLELNNLDGEPRVVHFTDDAQQLFIKWMSEIQDAGRSPDIHPALESHILKMPQTIAGLALLFEIIDGGYDAVGIEATARSLDWADYLLSHAGRMYSIATNQSLDSAHLILKRKDRLTDPFTVRDIQRKGWTGLNDIDVINEALNWLLDYGYLFTRKTNPSDNGGRPTVIFEWNNETTIGES